ncbi:MAG: hypothetical protein GX535_18040 [Xanthomonadaceae bacterium]|nr:hypothetical protein [Gemmatimonadales bacterium]NLG78141.1 hypothetical protein [Xanthomonadaceae bacterium]
MSNLQVVMRAAVRIVIGSYAGALKDAHEHPIGATWQGAAIALGSVR